MGHGEGDYRGRLGTVPPLGPLSKERISRSDNPQMCEAEC